MSLDGMALLLGENGHLIAERRGWINAMGVGSRDELIALLGQKGYPAHEAVLAFDAQFGGLILPEEGEEEESELGIHVGTYNCLVEDGHSSPRGGRTDLVPIMYTANDCIVFMDADGKTHFEDTIEGPDASPFTDTGAAALIELVRAGH